MNLVADFLRGYTGNTAKAYTRDLADFLTYLGDADLLTVTRTVVDGYARDLEERKLAPSTAARRLSTLNGLYTYAVREGILAKNPVTYVRRPVVSQESQTLGLSQAEAVALLQVAKSDELRSYVLVKLLLQTAMRIGEALALEADDIYVDGGHQVVRVHGKGGKIRVIPIPGVAADLAQLLEGRTDGPVFRSRTGGAWSYTRAFRKVQALAVAAKLVCAERITPHSLRHTSITAAYDNGGSTRDVQSFAGHADPRTTQRYDRARGQLDRSPAHALASYFEV